jgi:hypothetical protein
VPGASTLGRRSSRSPLVANAEDDVSATLGYSGTADAGTTAKLLGEDAYSGHLDRSVRQIVITRSADRDRLIGAPATTRDCLVSMTLLASLVSALGRIAG